MRYIFIKLIKIYSFLLSPLLGRNCRFYPTCSSYMQIAIQKHGVLKGLWLGGRRLLRCHPYFHGNAMDDVPDTVAWRDLIGYNRHSSKENKPVKK